MRILLPSSSNKISDIEYADSIIAHVQRKVTRRSAQELLKFLHASALNTKDYKTELFYLS